MFLQAVMCRTPHSRTQLAYLVLLLQRTQVIWFHYTARGAFDTLAAMLTEDATCVAVCRLAWYSS